MIFLLKFNKKGSGQAGNRDGDKINAKFEMGTGTKTEFLKTGTGDRDGDTNLENRGPGTGTRTETVGTNIPGTEIAGTVPGTDSAGTEIPGPQIFRGQLSPSPAHLWLTVSFYVQN